MDGHFGKMMDDKCKNWTDIMMPVDSINVWRSLAIPMQFLFDTLSI